MNDTMTTATIEADPTVPIIRADRLCRDDDARLGRVRGEKVLLLAAVAGVVMACSSTSAADHAPQVSPSSGSPLNSPDTSSTVYREVLAFPKGERRTESVTVRALSPPTHTYSLSLTAPSAADFAVAVRTWYGVEYTPIESLKRAGWCTTSRALLSCRVVHPCLEAQRPGPWTFDITKLSAAPMRVDLTIRWDYSPGCASE